MAIELTVRELRTEIAAFREIAKKFLAPGADQVLAQAAASLEVITRSHGSRIPWNIVPTNALHTKLSHGSYQRDDRGSAAIYAEITFLWDLTPVRANGDSRPAKRVVLDGRASTVIRIMKGDPLEDPVEVGMWRMEVANDDSPGAFFHVQVMGRDEDVVFPKSVDVPRLPNLLISPFACGEFAIGELFQDDWDRHSAKASGAMNQWRAVQANRILKQLRWHQSQVEATSGSPWAAWKRATPQNNLFG